MAKVEGKKKRLWIVPMEIDTVQRFSEDTRAPAHFAMDSINVSGTDNNLLSSSGSVLIGA